jgi:hypothetical protein
VSKPAAAVSLDLRSDGALLFASQATGREENIMLASAVAAAKNMIVRCARALWRTVKCVMEPARSATTAAAGAVRDSARSRSDLIAENAFLRQQLIVVSRSVSRPAFHRGDRLVLLLLARICRTWRDALHLVQPDTLLRWHRDLFKIVWRRKSRRKGQPRRLPQETIEQIQRMARDNLLWGAERIRGELLKLGIPVSKRTIQKYMRRARPPGKRSQTWETFFENQCVQPRLAHSAGASPARARVRSPVA